MESVHCSAATTHGLIILGTDEFECPLFQQTHLFRCIPSQCSVSFLHTLSNAVMYTLCVFPAVM